MAGVASPSQTIGPMYGFALTWPGCHMTIKPDSPEAVTIVGHVRDGRGEPIAHPDALVEFWHGDQFARSRTNSYGCYQVVMRKPSAGPPLDGRPQAPHLKVALFARGLLKQAQTLMFFPDEADANAADPILNRVDASLRHLLIAREVDGGLRFDINLQGENETVFFAF